MIYSSKGKMEILLVEDNPGDILLIQNILEELEEIDTKLIVKTNGLAADNYIKEEKKVPDLIVLDLNLPHKNGFDVLTEIISNRLFHSVPVIIFTSSDNQSDTARALSMGAKAYVIKPIDLDEYRDKVISFFNYVQK
jgi:DNA-binding response OmpR family regulator